MCHSGSGIKSVNQLPFTDLTASRDRDDYIGLKHLDVTIFNDYLWIGDGGNEVMITAETLPDMNHLGFRPKLGDAIVDEECSDLSFNIHDCIVP